MSGCNTSLISTEKKIWPLLSACHAGILADNPMPVGSVRFIMQFIMYDELHYFNYTQLACLMFIFIIGITKRSHLLFSGTSNILQQLVVGFESLRTRRYIAQQISAKWIVLLTMRHEWSNMSACHTGASEKQLYHYL